jgi:hypothetical protein
MSACYDHPPFYRFLHLWKQICHPALLSVHETHLTLPGMHGAYADLEASKRTLLALQALDARDDVLLLLSHDDSVNDTIRWFPDAANEWKSEGWKEKVYWAFLKEGSPSNRWTLDV